LLKANFLFEIGTEEIPAGYINNAVEKLKESFIADLTEYKLNFEKMDLFSTPRRLAVKIIGLDTVQQDETVEKSGPAKRVAYDESGNLTKAGQGFLVGAGANENDLYIQTTPKGEYVAVKVFIKGKNTRELLPAMMKNAIERIVFPKTMKWGEENFMFGRPIRWIVAITDSKEGCSQDVDFEFRGVKAGRISFGNRYEGLENSIEINNVEVYPDILKGIKVMADRQERKDLIRKQIVGLCEENRIVSEDERLLDTVVDLVEYPTAVVANFSEKYLELPAKIIISTLSQNQKYFTTVDKNGNLKSEFVFISNGNPAFSEIIKVGNEKVVKARLEDAQFYFQEDTKRPFDEYVEKLSEVVFQAKLGTLLEKTNRVVALCDWIAGKLEAGSQKLCDGRREGLLRAARLCKADLVTMMLGEKEFTKLQGYIGMNYALISNEKPEVAKAIYEHYMPRGQHDDLPSEEIGAILAIADKLDTVCGIIGAGLIPTGSNDPFALRRAANGIVQIIDKYNFDISVSELVLQAFEVLKSKVSETEKSVSLVNDFLKQRIRWLLEEHYHIEYDVMDALDIFAWDKVTEIKNRAIDLQKFKVLDEFKVLVSGFKRVSNILDKNRVEVCVDESLLKEENQVILYKHLDKLKAEVKALFEKMEYSEIMKKIVPMGSDIDGSFDKVLVMCDDVRLKNNRLALMQEIRELFLKVADVSKISYET